MRVIDWQPGSVSLRGLVPIRLVRGSELTLMCAWAKPSVSLLSCPMYEWAFTNGEAVYTSLSPLNYYATRFEVEKLCASIFHISRCGSTAIANGLRSIPRTIVLSEAGIISTLLLRPEAGGIELATDRKSQLLYGILGAILKENPGNAIVIKHSSFVSNDIAYALDILPASHLWCFATRNPAEVIRSFDRSPSGWLSTAAGRMRAIEILGLSDASTTSIPTDELLANLLNRYMTSALHSASSKTIYLDYEFFSAQSVSEIIAFFLGVDLDSEGTKLLEDELKSYSKSTTSRAFKADARIPSATTGFASLDTTYNSYFESMTLRGARKAASGTSNLFDGSL